MRAIIIEDEYLAAHALTRLVAEIAPEIKIEAVLQSTDESVEWFNANTMPDLVFMDIHLADGSSFAIFDDVNITCPIIFTTAYDEYALKAFEVNSIDYLLKPIESRQLERAISKVKRLYPNNNPENQTELMNRLLASMQKPVTYKSSFLIPVKDKLIPLNVKEIAYFFIDTKVIKAVTYLGKSYSLDLTMEEIMKQLHPEQFYRANRQYIVGRSAVKDITMWFGNKIAVTLKVDTPERIIVSRINAKEFKEWLTD
jgi:Response regulator of the LytR/AlgR family